MREFRMPNDSEFLTAFSEPQIRGMFSAFRIPQFQMLPQALKSKPRPCPKPALSWLEVNTYCWKTV